MGGDCTWRVQKTDKSSLHDPAHNGLAARLPAKKMEPDAFDTMTDASTQTNRSETKA